MTFVSVEVCQVVGWKGSWGNHVVLCFFLSLGGEGENYEEYSFCVWGTGVYATHCICSGQVCYGKTMDSKVFVLTDIPI